MRILCFGDSNTYGYDPRGCFGGRYEAENRWVDLLAKQTGWHFLNAGVNGREIPRNVHMLHPLAAHAPVDILLIMLGTNDLLQGATAKEAAARMDAFLKSVLPCCNLLLLVCPPPMARGAWVPDNNLVTESLHLSAEYRILAEKYRIPFIDTSLWNIPLAFDGVHFTEEGHHVFANQLLTEVLPWLI